MRGYGKSALTDGPISRRRDLEVLLDQLGIAHAVLLGCSMGGTIVLDYALEHPERVDGLVLVSAVPSGFEMQGEPPPNVVEMIAAMQRGDLERVSELQVRLWVDGPFRGPEEVDPEVRRRAAEMNWTPVQNGTWSKVDTQPVDLLDPPAIGRLGEVRVPTLVVVGALDDPELLRAGEVLKEGIAGAAHVIIQGAAHVPNLEKPEEFNRVVVKFLAGARLMDAP
jgi:pimeloyl-ACP methyl ester carboxylesterase